MRILTGAAVFFILAWIGWFVYVIEASRYYTAAGMGLTMLAATVIGFLSFAAVWLIALVAWTVKLFRDYRQARADRLVEPPSQ